MHCMQITFFACSCVPPNKIDLYLLTVMLPKAAVVCVLLTLLSAGSQGNQEANVNNHHLALWKERFGGLPIVFRRDSETCLPFSDDYYRRLRLLHCDEKYIQAVFNEIETSNCGNNYYNDTFNYYNDTFNLFFSECGTNHNGTVCGSILVSKYDNFYNKCGIFEFYTSNCSSECQMELRQLSDSVGCCIHDNFFARFSSMWMNCDIEQPEVCADTPNTADALAKHNVDPCTWECSRRWYYYVFCKYVGEEYEQINRECGYEDVVNYCGFDKGEFCIEMYSNYNYQIETMIAYDCYSNSEEGNQGDNVCSTNCKNVLVELIDTVGCCFNFLNSTFPGLSYDLFSACGIEVPDTCNSFSSTAVPDDFLECTINNSGTVLQSGVYSIGFIIIGLISTYI